ncbi:MAG TPA: alpha-amylase family glycosyl hydrolase [Polyangia bacterium]|nr:alpha-amylase family glycosyl hydrolase [Polyangia bacterium]
MPAMIRFAIVALLVAGCGKGVTDPLPNPPSNPFNPGDPGSGGYGSGSGGGGAGIPSGPPMCDTTLRRCAHEFDYGLPPGTLTGHEKTVTLIGDYRTDSWTNGDAATFDGSKWAVTVPVPWATAVTYKFHITYDNGTADAYLPDPSNPTTVPDGFGGKNSVFSGTTCETWTCASTQIACAGTPLSPTSFDWRDAVIYWAFVDRFVDGDMTNDAPISDPRLTGNAANWQGGDWKGLQSKIASGYFAALGVNTLWITVPVDNSESVGQGTNGDTYWYTAYHGYWPRDLTQTESRFGAAADLTALVGAAHTAGIKVIADYTMNHVHKDSPIYQAHTSDGWFNPLVQNGETCICNGIANDPCNYDGTLGKSCWFADYLPDWNFANAAARAWSVDNALMWIKTYGFDGFRLDAVKHIETTWLTDLRSALLTQVEATTKQHVYLVGETFTGDQNLIKSFISPCTELDGQFDFPLRAQLVQNVIMRQGKMNDLITFMDSNTSFYGTSVMSTFLGNHDVPRTIHFGEDTPVWSDVWASGKDRNWSNQPTQPTSGNAYERLALGFALLWTNRGAPMIYYGDEIGLAGAGDPDNRRMMPWTGYSAAQSALLGKVEKLGTIRAAHTALRRGDRTTLSYGDDTWVYQMVDGSDHVYVAINRSDATVTVSGLPAGALTDQMTGEALSGPSVSLPPRTARVMTP